MARCRICKTTFKRLGINHRACSIPCALELAKLDREKRERKADREKKVKLRTRREWLTLAQAAFNKYIRARDAKEPCISCGRFHQGQNHAGHFLSTGAHPELRFDESNCALQCQPCNTHLSGNIAKYRPNLIAKVGLAEVERLEGPQEAKKWTVAELQEIIRVYKDKAKQFIEQEG